MHGGFNRPGDARTRNAEGSFPGRVLFGTLGTHLLSFFYDLRRNRFDVRKYGVERDGGKKPR